MATNLNFTSPKGTAQYAWLNTPDTAFGQNSYKVSLRVPADEAKEFIDLCKKVANENLGAKAKDCKMPYEVDKETGEVVLKLKSKFKPKFADTTGRLTNHEPRVGGGSVLKIKGNFYPYDSANTGISLQMKSVQVIELVEFGGEAFDAEEGSFTAANDGGNDNYNF